ncbi:hypothetical protein RchiOBHm_Chr5g0073731 [Rosa chinensis]|uniref:Uncharacterized protein n=1 Tax=Rosa chinensis TaxID=74649 RepID=A0A2P6QL11_ROSCH|nr:hypothetical protein RchiOBHm_Chr5g0073731 [Rosa chinensis]
MITLEQKKIAKRRLILAKRLLVYEYLENKSLDQALFGMRIPLSIYFF